MTLIRKINQKDLFIKIYNFPKKHTFCKIAYRIKFQFTHMPCQCYNTLLFRVCINTSSTDCDHSRTAQITHPISLQNHNKTNKVNVQMISNRGGPIYPHLLPVGGP